MFLFKASAAGIGFEVPEITIHARLRGGVAQPQGAVVQFDFANLESEVTDNNMDGGEDSGFANVKVPASITRTDAATNTPATASNRSMYAVIKGAAGIAGTSFVLDNGLAEVCMYGVVQASVWNYATGTGLTAVNFAKGDDLFVNPTINSGGLGPATTYVSLTGRDVAIAASGSSSAMCVGFQYPIVAKMLETVTDADPKVLAKVWFWGGLPFGIWVPVGTT